MAFHGIWGFNDTTGAADPPFTQGGAAYATSSQRTGAAALSCSTTASSFPLASGQATVIFGGAYQPQSAFVAGDMILFQEGATIHCRVSVDSTGHLIIKGAANTTLATSTYVMTLAQYDYIEAKAVIHDTAGAVEIKVAGTVVLSVTSQDTKNGGTGVVDNVAVRRIASSMVLDDVYLLDSVDATATQGAPNNTYVGDCAVRTLLPANNGDSSQLTGSDGNSTDNYLLVDEANANTSDYVGAASASLKDLYQMGDIPTTDLPLAWMVLVYAAKSDAGTPPTFRALTKGDGGTELNESAITLGTTYARFAGAIHSKDPDGDALSATNVNGMQAGVKSA